MSEWADRYRELSPEASAEHGRWRTDRAPYQRGMMDAFNDASCHTVVIMSSAQVGKTEMINNVLGYMIDLDPGPCLILQPTLQMAQAWSKDRLAPMLQCERLKNKVKERRSKDSDNTILHKVFPGGFLAVAGSNSASSLASRPCRFVFADEVDRYPVSAGAEGDPLNLAFKRTTTFWNRKRLVTSTPTIRGESRIEAAFEESSQEHYYVPCPHCDEMQRLYWKNIHWPKGRPEDARYVCEECGAEIEDRHKADMLRGGEWRAENDRIGVRGFHINELYSPWVRFGEMAAAFVEAKKMPETLKTWVNTALGETWEDEGIEIATDELMERAETLDELPEGVLCVTCAVDVQDDRLEALVMGWGQDQEAWSLDHQIWHGDPGRLDLWGQLETFLKKTYGPLRIACTVIDSGGHFTNQVYRFVKPKYAQRVYAIKGVGGAGRALVGRPTKGNKLSVNLFPVGVDTAKELAFSRLTISTQGAGFIHWSDRFDEEFFKQLTAERRIEKYQRGQKTYVWKKVRARNEAWDLLVYNIAAFELLNPNLDALQLGPSEPRQKQPDDVAKSPLVQQRIRRPGFVNSWR